MSYQDILMNFVTIEAGHPEDPVWVMCATCGPIAKLDFTAANDVKIKHENDHGIFLDTDAGEGLYYDPEEDQFRE